MWREQKIENLVSGICLAHLLLCGVQNLTTNLNQEYETQIDLRFVLTQEQSITEVHSIFQQVHLRPEKGVFQDLYEFFLDKRSVYAI